jgi:hypothetical protein
MRSGSFIHALTIAVADTSVTDRELLSRFASSGDSAAFKLLVRRHAELVWQVCRGILPTDGTRQRMPSKPPSLFWRGRPVQFVTHQWSVSFFELRGMPPCVNGGVSVWSRKRLACATASDSRSDRSQ